MNRKKTANAIQQEVTREIEQLLRTIFTGVRKSGPVDLEALEMLVRSAMHQAGAAGQFPADEELDIVHSEFSPGVRRMQALVGQDASITVASR